MVLATAALAGMARTGDAPPWGIILVPVILGLPTRRSAHRSDVIGASAITWATIPHPLNLGVRSTLKERQHR